MSHVTCLACPTFQAMLLKTVIMLKPLEALLPGELDGTLDDRQTDNRQTDDRQADDRQTDGHSDLLTEFA